MIRLLDLRHDPSRTPLAWALVCLLVAQVLFPIQLHTTWGMDDHGQVVQICTLQGVKTVLVDPLTGQEQVVVDHDDQRSPACTFSQLMAEALDAAPVLMPGWLTLATAVADPFPAKALPAPVLRRATIRAPPVVA